MNRTVHYRSVDPIQNLKLRVRLTCRSGSNTDHYAVPDEHADEDNQQGKKGKGRGLGRLFGKGGKDEEGEEEAAEGGGVESTGGADKDKKDKRVGFRGRFWKKGGDDAEGEGSGEAGAGEGTDEGAADKEADDAEEHAADEEAEGPHKEAEEGGQRMTTRGGTQKATTENLYGLETCVRDIGWQEKVFSSSEITAALEHQEELGLTSTRALRQSRTSPKKSQQLRHLANVSLRDQYRHTIQADSRYAAEAFSNNRIFTYINADEYSDRNETDRTITTSQNENQNPLVMMMYTRPQHRNEVLKHQTMFVMADCGEDPATGERVEFPLVLVRSYPDGSFEMRPGFNRKGEDGSFIDDPYEFEDVNGMQWEFTIENAARTDTTAEERRREQLTKQHNERARMLRKALTNTEFQRPPGPSPDAMRFMLMAEIMAAKEFERDQLWVQYELRYDPELWHIPGHMPEKGEVPGVLTGCTQVSHCTMYPGDPGTGQLPYYVAHFAHPVEAEFIAQQEPLPNQWPTIYFQVNTYDYWDRYTVEGYTWFSLHSVSQGGCQVHRLPTWKPLGTVQDRVHSFFVGGSAELKDMTYSGIPQDFSGNFLSKFGFKAETSGTLKLRTMSVVQQRRPEPEPLDHTPLGRKSPGRKSPGPRSMDMTRRREMMDLAKVVERARRRLEAARGGPVVVRGEALDAMAEPPLIAKDTSPEEEEAEEGGLAVFSVVAKGRAPLRYNWFFGAEKIVGPNAASQSLMLRDVQLSETGEYSCVISNADGKVTSRKAKLTVVPALGFVEQPGSHVEKYAGQTVELAVEGKGKPPLNYQWFKREGQNKVNELDYDDTCSSPVLVIEGVVDADKGFYWCEVSNEGGKERSEVTRLVILPDTDGIYKNKGEKKAEGAANEEGKGAGEGAAEQEGGEEGEDADETGSVVEHDVDQEPIGGGGEEEGDEVEEEEEEGAGEEGEADHAEPEITEHPRGVTSRRGDPAEFRVAARGEGPLWFQWLHDGRELKGETQLELAFLEAEPRHAGMYSCRVSNAHGKVETRGARLEVEAGGAGDTAVEAFDEDEVEEFVAE